MLISIAYHDDMPRLGPFRHEETEGGRKQDQVPDRVGPQVNDGLRRIWHVKGVISHREGRVTRACFGRAWNRERQGNRGSESSSVGAGHCHRVFRSRRSREESLNSGSGQPRCAVAIAPELLNYPRRVLGGYGKVAGKRPKTACAKFPIRGSCHPYCYHHLRLFAREAAPAFLAPDPAYFGKIRPCFFRDHLLT